MSDCRTTPCCQEQETPCPVEKSVKEACCPVEKSIECLTGSFFQAMKATQVDILKEKIRKNWGALLEKEADAIIAAMGARWHSMMAQAKAQAELRENIKNILKSAQG